MYSVAEANVESSHRREHSMLRESLEKHRALSDEARETMSRRIGELEEQLRESKVLIATMTRERDFCILLLRHRGVIE